MGAYLRKELMEYIRTGRLVILSLIFIAFGILNPAIAKLTPWFIEQYADDMAKSGFTVSNVTVTAMSSWEQFFGNYPMVLIVFLLVIGGTFATEYKSGAFVFAVTRGLKRGKIVLAKTIMLFTLWTLLSAVFFFITYGYTVYYWDDYVPYLFEAVIMWWLFGLWVISLFIFSATCISSMSGALGVTAGVYFVAYLISMAPKASEYLPTFLTGGLSLLSREHVPDNYESAVIVTVVSMIVFLVGAVFTFRKKQL